MVSCIQTMVVFSDTFLVLGAIFGVATVYLAPYSISNKSTRCKMKNNKNTNKNRSTINVPESASILINGELSPKLYGETTMTNVLSMIKMEISKVLNAEKWTIIVPNEKDFDSSNDFFDAKSQFLTPGSDIPLDSIDIDDIPDDCTEYKDIPEMLFSGSDSKKRKMKKYLRKFYKGIKSLGVSKNNKRCMNLPRQSTFISTKSKACPKYVILGENTLDELQTFAADSGYSVITIDNDNIELSFKKSKSPINKLFQKVKNLLGLKRNLLKENNNVGSNFSIITDKKINHNNTS